MSENSWRLGERISSGVNGDGAVTSMLAGFVLSGSFAKIASKSVRNAEMTGAGILRVGEKTIPTLRTLILLILDLLTMLMRNADRARTKVQLAKGNLCTSTLYASILDGLSSSSRRK